MASSNIGHAGPRTRAKAAATTAYFEGTDLDQQLDADWDTAEVEAEESDLPEPSEIFGHN